MTPHKIVLISPNGRYDEHPANAALSPGHFLELLSTGKVRKVGTAGIDIPVFVAIEDSLQGLTIDDAYAADNPVRGWYPAKGDVILGRIPIGANIAVGDDLKFSNDGTMIAQGGTGTIKAEAAEAVDNSAGSAEAFIRVRIK